MLSWWLYYCWHIPSGKLHRKTKLIIFHGSLINMFTLFVYKIQKNFVYCALLNLEWEYLSLSYMIWKNGQTYFKNLAVFTPQNLLSMFGHFSKFCMRRLIWVPDISWEVAKSIGETKWLRANLRARLWQKQEVAQWDFAFSGLFIYPILMLILINTRVLFVKSETESCEVYVYSKITKILVRGRIKSSVEISPFHAAELFDLISKTSDFLTFSGVIERNQWHEIC